MLRTILISTALAVTGAAAHAQEMSEAESVARAYMDAYSRIDLDAMASFVADDVLFVDATATGEVEPLGFDAAGASSND